MDEYRFSYEGRTITVRASRLRDAYAEANKRFGVLPQGAWMDTAGVRSYRWMLGNFFD
jgi:hypothetical protein